MQDTIPKQFIKKITQRSVHLYAQETYQENIPQEYKDVIKELLSTDKFFVSHSGNNAETKAEVEAHKKFKTHTNTEGE